MKILIVYLHWMNDRILSGTPGSHKSLRTPKNGKISSLHSVHGNKIGNFSIFSVSAEENLTIIVTKQCGYLFFRVKLLQRFFSLPLLRDWKMWRWKLGSAHAEEKLPRRLKKIDKRLKLIDVLEQSFGADQPKFARKLVFEIAQAWM